MKQKWRKWKENLRLILRGYKLLGAIGQGKVLIYRAGSAALGAIAPLVTLYFSGQIIDELAGARGGDRLFFLACLTVSVNLILLLLKKLLSRREEALDSMFWDSVYMVYSQKMLEMDYEDVEDSRTHEQLGKIKDLHNWGGKGIWTLANVLGRLTEGFVGVVVSLSMTMGLFFAPAKKAEGWAAVFASPVGTALIIAVLAGSMLVFKICATKQNEATMDLADNMTLGNRIFSYYGGALLNDHKAGKDVRLYSEAAMVKEECENSHEILFSALRRVVKTFDTAVAAESACPYLLGSFVYLYVAAKAWCGAISLGGVVQYAGAISRFSSNLQKLADVMADLSTNNETLNLNFEFLDKENKKYRGTLPTEKRLDNDFLIEFHDVSFRYPGTEAWALRHVSMKLKIGERLAVVGRNGSGKTTMIKLLCRLYDPTEGSITLNGIDIRKYDYDEYLALFSVVFQDFHLFSFQLGQSVAASVEYDGEKVKRSLEEAGLGERLLKMPQGLETYLNKDFDESGVEVSGGEAQKAAIARALYKGAPFLVLDEPTAALDPVAEYEIYRKFAEIAGEKTAVCISHRLSSCRFCDRIAVFQSGQLVQTGSHDQLLEEKDGAYRALWDAQAQYYAPEDEE